MRAVAVMAGTSLVLMWSWAASAVELNPGVKQAVDRAQAAEKTAIADANRAKQAAAEAMQAAKTGAARASAAKAIPESALGLITTKDGAKLRGQVHDGKIDGLCVADSPRGARYEGECRNSALSGYGIELDGAGNRYEGAFEGNQRHGSGRSTLADGARYEGEWQKGARAGYGTLTLSGGDSYQGHLAQGKPDGSGVRRLHDGSSYAGDWRDGRADGFGVHVMSDGSFYMGGWKQNKYDGAGLFASRPEKKVTQGLWERGTLKQELGPELALAPPGKAPAPGAPSQPGQPANPGGPRMIGNGTGFYVTKAGHIITNDHVTRGCGSLRARPVGEPSVPVRMIATSKPQDLSLLKAEPVETIVPFRSTPALRAGDGVVVFGFPLTGLVASTGNLTTGYVTALAGIGDSTDLLQISAQIQPGNSGGPVLDMTGNLVGVAELTLDTPRAANQIGANPQNINFAIKASVVTSFLDTHGVRYDTQSAGAPLSVADVGEKARAFTVRVECYK